LGLLFGLDFCIRWEKDWMPSVRMRVVDQPARTMRMKLMLLEWWVMKWRMVADRRMEKMMWEVCWKFEVSVGFIVKSC